MSANGQNDNEIVTCYNSKNIPKKSCFVEYHFGEIYIKKAFIQSVLFCVAWRYQLVQDPKVWLKSNLIKLVYLFIFQKFHFQTNNFVSYYAIKRSMFDLKWYFLHESSIEFDGEHVGMLCSAIRNCLEIIPIFTPCFGVYLHTKSSSSTKWSDGSLDMHSNDWYPFIIRIYRP